MQSSRSARPKVDTSFLRGGNSKQEQPQQQRRPPTKTTQPRKNQLTEVKKAVKVEFKRVMPLIFGTDIPDKLKLELLDGLLDLIIIQAPTGYGKTVLVNYTLALINKLKAAAGEKVTCVSLMPFRVSVKEMYVYLTKLFPELDFGYAMRGDSNVAPTNNCKLMTVGFWLEQFFAKYREHGLPTEPMIVMVDEAHDATWQTDLALRVLLWLQAKGSPGKVIISSATLDVAQTLKTFKGNKEPLVLSVDDQKANVNVMFHEKYIEVMENGKITGDLLREMLRKLELIYQESDSGDVLVILPGQDEIDKFIELIEKNQLFAGSAVHALHSQLSREEIELAIVPDASGKRKIIIATNIVESAVTIKDLMYVIDAGLRKVNKIDENGVQQLVLELAAQSNLKQALGRVGRQGVRGTAYLMMSKSDFERRRPYAENEVHLNPLYLQIMKLVHNGLPVKEVLSHVSPYRIDKDTEFLIRHGALMLNNRVIVVTELGKIMAHLPLSIRASHFMSIVVKNIPSQFWYTACVVAAWMDSASSLFFRPGRKPQENPMMYNDRLMLIQELQSEFHESDCIKTTLNIWFTSWTVPKNYKGGFYGWCNDNGLFGRTLKDMNNDVNHIISALGGLGFNVEVPNVEQCTSALQNLSGLIAGLIPAMEIAFADWVFTSQGFRDEYKSATSGFETHKIDGKIGNSTVTRGGGYAKVIALALRRITTKRGTMILMSKIVELPTRIAAFPFEPDFDNSDEY